MKKLSSLIAVLALIITISASSFALPVSAATKITTTPTGYTSAEDVDYLIKDGTVVNWGARGEDCVFLSKCATDFYTDNNTYDNFITKNGGTTQSNAPQSALYSTLKNFMESKHHYKISYDATRGYYKYTDCVSNNYEKLSSFYTGTLVNSTWDSGKTYNREHTWPNSKGLGGKDENDIMMLRPTIPSENGNRSNTAYGESRAYFDPGVSVHGDVARIFLYVYVRWGNTSYAWGTSGVMENMNVLLKWMEEDPVDTWEMGRNDAVQSITGTRNVFIDYPELAWKLFGREIPDNMTTPSMGASASTGGDSTGDSSTGSSSSNCITDGHKYSVWIRVFEPTENKVGLEQRTCRVCGETQTREIPALSQGKSQCNGALNAPLLGMIMIAFSVSYVLKKKSK